MPRATRTWDLPVPGGPTLDYLATLEWITAAENLCLVGPPGTGKSHVLVLSLIHI